MPIPQILPDLLRRNTEKGWTLEQFSAERQIMDPTSRAHHLQNLGSLTPVPQSLWPA